VKIARSVLLLAAAAATAAVSACQSSRATPPEVRSAHVALRASLDPAAPGLSLLRLQEFARRHARYDIAPEVSRDITRWQPLLEPAYRRARDLAREGAFDAAEDILADLALVPDQPAGRQAREFLAFEFHEVKASRLLVTGDAEGAEAAARQALGRPLDEGQMAAAQQLLDAAALAKLGATMTRTTALRSAAKVLQTWLYSNYVDNGRFPERLTLDDPDLAPLRDTGTLDVVAGFEDYRAADDTFSVLVVGRSGERFRVTERVVEPVPAPTAGPR